MNDEKKKIRPEKEAIEGTVRDEVSEASFIFLVNYSGLSVDELKELRDQLGGCNARFRVVQNWCITRVADGFGWSEIQAVIDGPTGVVLGNGDITGAAKAVDKFMSDRERDGALGGMMGDRYLAATDVLALAKMPTKQVLQASLVGTLAAPMTGVVGVLNQKLASLLYVLKAIQDKKS